MDVERTVRQEDDGLLSRAVLRLGDVGHGSCDLFLHAGWRAFGDEA